jgi:predicted glutamine amidotransferase
MSYQKEFMDNMSLENMHEWLEKEYGVDLNKDYDDVQHLKNGVFTKLYEDAKKYLSNGTVSRYRRAILMSGNNRHKMIRNSVLSLGRAIYKKRMLEKNNGDKL